MLAKGEEMSLVSGTAIKPVLSHRRRDACKSDRAAGDGPAG
jgi:hypothetical protein